jgi:hypothetical protein
MAKPPCVSAPCRESKTKLYAFYISASTQDKELYARLGRNLNWNTITL